MEEVVYYGAWSLLPAVIAIVLSFLTKNTIFSLLIACIAGTLVAGQGLMGFPNLLKQSLGSTGFAWVMLLNTFIGILVAYFRKTGAIQGFTEMMRKRTLSRKKVQLTSWFLGMFVYFSDSFSPLFVGTTMRSVSDEAKISREKLSYIADSTSAPVSVLVPITGWAAYLATQSVGHGSIVTPEDGAALFLNAIIFNFYPIIAVLFVGLIASGIIKDFGPMKKAEERALNEGKVLRDGANPLIGKELTELESAPIKTRIFLNFLFPVIMIISIAIFTYITMGSAKTMEAFLFTILFMSVSLFIQGISLKEITETATNGIKGAIPAVIILALAYSVNNLSGVLGTAKYIIGITEGLLTPHLLPVITFAIAATIAFSTGSSWGTFAICMPIALPLAFEFTGDQVNTLVMATFAAVAGGGVFGDHCSPLSDTTILASTGAAADHLDHVKTQIPYSLICAGLAIIAYLILGYTAI